jgi:hypothetical protein
LDGQHSEFFEWLAKEKLAKKCVKLRAGYVEQIPSLVAVACLIPGRGKDLSAPPRKYPVYVALGTFLTFFIFSSLGTYAATVKCICMKCNVM